MSINSHCDGLLTKKSTNNGFQAYSTCREILVAEVPDSLPLANAAVIPLGFSTAASGLFVNHKLPLPSLAPESTGKRVLIWGGSSSVGSSAIQLAVAAGFQVLATASPANHEYLKSLGASYAIDHRDAEVVDKIKAIMKPGDVVFDCISTADTQDKCGAIIDSIGGGQLPIVLFPQGNVPESVERSFGKTLLLQLKTEAPTNSVIVNGLAPGLTNPEVGDGTWRKFLGQALAAGKFQAKPDPHVITGGLPRVQEGLDLLKKGVSATKVVIEISRE